MSVHKLACAIDARRGKGLNGARILVLGIAYKKNVDDTRESPGLRIIEMLEQRGAKVSYYDPYVPVIPETREHKLLAGRRSLDWSPADFGSYDAILIVTDHDDVDYGELVTNAQLVIDTRNVCRRAGLVSPHVLPA